jgi:hypothetical protein
MSFATAIRVAGRAAAAASGVKIKIQRGSVIDQLPALRFGQLDVYDADGRRLGDRIRSQDFLVLSELYDFGDGPVEPARGDRLSAREDDGDHTYELLDLTNEKSWRWSDPWKQRLRLHTKEIAKPA